MNIIKKNKNKKSIFLKIYTIFFSILILLIAIGLIIFWNYLADYEKTVPTNLLTPIVDEINNNNFDVLFDNANFEMSEFESKDNFINYMKSKTSDSKITYSQQTLVDNDNVYKLKVDDKDIATISLKKSDKKSKFGFTQYQIDKITDIGGADNTMIIYAPSTAKLTLNDKDVANSYIVEKDIDIEDLEYLPEDFEKPTMVKYEIKGLYEEGLLEATGYLGNKLLISKDDTTGEFTVKSNGPQEMSSQFDELITEASQSYAKYITNDVNFNEIGKYIAPESPLYKTIASMEVSWYTTHEKFEFKNIKTYDYTSYSDNCFSYRITFDHYVYRISAGKTFHYSCDYTIIFAKKNGDWKIYDMIINNEE